MKKQNGVVVMTQEELDAIIATGTNEKNREILKQSFSHVIILPVVKDWEDEYNLNQKKYSTNEVLSILREYREYAWVNGLTRYDLEQWIVKKFNINTGEHFSKKK